jgi:hypothetical protein
VDYLFQKNEQKFVTKLMRQALLDLPTWPRNFSAVTTQSGGKSISRGCIMLGSNVTFFL